MDVVKCRIMYVVSEILPVEFYIFCTLIFYIYFCFSFAVFMRLFIFCFVFFYFFTSTYKRYFYTNNKTGESQWDYPQSSTDSSSVKKEKTSSVQGNNGSGSWGTANILEFYMCCMNSCLYEKIIQMFLEC